MVGRSGWELVPGGSGLRLGTCYGQDGRPDADRARALLELLAGIGAQRLARGIDGGLELLALYEEVGRLPERFTTCRLHLHGDGSPLPPAIERLRRSLADGDEGTFRDALPTAVALADNLDARERLALALARLAAAGRVDPLVAATAYLDLGIGTGYLLRAALVASLADLNRPAGVPRRAGPGEPSGDPPADRRKARAG